MTVDRRKFLALGGSSLLLAACDSPGPRGAGGLLRWFERRNEIVERGLLRHSSMDRGLDVKTAGQNFPRYYISDRVPVWDEASRGVWTLEVTGAVRRPVRLTLPQLVALPRRAQRVNHYCVEGWVAVAEWSGVRLRELAALVEPTRDARFVDFQSFDKDYHESWDLESAMHPQTLIAYAKDGRYLDPGYGAPARLHSPVKLGYKNVKYLTKIVFLPEKNGGYWSDDGYEWFGGV